MDTEKLNVCFLLDGKMMHSRFEMWIAAMLTVVVVILLLAPLAVLLDVNILQEPAIEEIHESYKEPRR